MHDQAETTAKEAFRLLTVITRPTVKSAGKLQKRLVIKDNVPERAQVWGTTSISGRVYLVIKVVTSADGAVDSIHAASVA